MTAFSEIKRIEAVIATESAKELERSPWYCQMRQHVLRLASAQSVPERGGG